MAMSYNFAMVTVADIQALADRIGGQFQPEKVILFGSYAHGTARGDSDVDLLVVIPLRGRRARDVRAEISHSSGYQLPLDIVVRDPSDLTRQYREFDPLVRDAVDHGMTLYEQDRAGVDQQG